MEAARLKDEEDRFEEVDWEEDSNPISADIAESTNKLSEDSSSDDTEKKLIEKWREIKENPELDSNIESLLVCAMSLKNRKIFSLNHSHHSEEILEPALALLDSILRSTNREPRGVFEYVTGNIVIAIVWDFSTNILVIIAGSLLTQTPVWVRMNLAGIARRFLQLQTT